MSFTFRRYDWRFGLAFFVILMLLVANGYLANRSINGLLEAQKWVVHAWQVRTALHDLRANSEASMLQSRSFYMMNDPTFLEGFLEAQKKSGDSLTVVEELTKDNTLEKFNTNALRRALKDQLDYANENVEKKRASGKAWSITPELITHFLKRSAAVQSLIGDMDTFEDKLATERLQQARVNEAQARLTILVATIVAAIALMGSLFLIRQYLKARQEVESVANELKTDLEKRVEERTQSLKTANASLVAVNNELEAFSYTVSHDLRAPLRHMMGFIALLDKKSGALLDDSGKRYVTLIKDAGHHAGILIDDLLAFSRTNRTEIKHIPISLKEIVDDIQAELARESSASAVTWEIAPLPVILGDATMLRLVWRNLLDNAVKYSSKVEVPWIEIGYQQTSTELVFFIKDNGVGFDMAHADKLFGVFQRLHENDGFPGTGIGLATVRRIVIRHGGRTWAESAPSAGATFYFSLPLERLLAKN